MLAQDDDIIAIPAIKRNARIDENLGTLDVTLSAASVQALSKAFPRGAAAYFAATACPVWQ